MAALQELALAMRAAADRGDAIPTVELASLIDQTADRIQDEGYPPRMEVDVLDLFASPPVSTSGIPLR